MGHETAMTTSVYHWLMAGACKATEPSALERVRQAVQAAVAADAPVQSEGEEK